MFHFQDSVNDWPSAVAALPAGAMVKAVDRGDILRDAKIANRQTFTVLRHWQQNQVFGGSEADNERRAREFFATFVDGTFRQQYAPHVNAVEELNEYLAWSQNDQEVGDRVRWARAAAKVWKEEYRAQAEYAHIRLILCNTAIGNDIHRAFAEIALEYDAIVGYHPYTYWDVNGRAANDWVDLSGRWHFMEKTWGLRPDWAFTEAGPFMSVIDGWRSPKCLDSSTAAYVYAVREWLRDVQQTPAYQEGRIKGFALFTTGGGHDWRLYETKQPEMTELAQMIAQEWKPGEPSPGPEPEPDVARISINRYWNLRSSPDFDDSRLYTMRAGTVLEYDGEVRGAAWGGSDKWYRANVYLHSAGATPIRAPGESFEFEAWPTDYVHVTQVFGANADYYGQWGLPGHEGVDIRAPKGSPIYAVAGGTVYLATGDSGNYGIQVRIEHRGGYRSVYAHLSSKTVANGDRVEAGEIIGYAGDTGNILSGGSHLHLTLKLDGDHAPGYPGNIIDPMPFVEKFNPTMPRRLTVIRRMLKYGWDQGKRLLSRSD